MRVLSASEWLTVWERGQGRSLPERALAILAAACPDMSLETLAGLSIGQRDAWLLTLREWTFGPRLAGLAMCPSCGERLELACNVADIQVTSPEEPESTLSLQMAGYEVCFRLPNSLDLMAVAASAAEVVPRQQLLERCLLAVLQHGTEQTIAQLPLDVEQAVVARMAQADPQADVQVALACPGCRHHWQAPFDIVSFFWNEINAWASRLLRDVHTLASAYGWREADILAMSPWRRQAYLEMVNG
jgi:hypothetical protein